MQEYKKACEGGHNKGCYNLAMMYYKGEGVMSNQEMAITYTRMACNQKYQAACDVLDKVMAGTLE